MAMTRIWLGQRLALSELPHEIRNAPIYQATDVFLDEAVISHNKKWIKLTFNGGAVHYWRYGEDGIWKYSQPSPTAEDLNDKVAEKAKAAAEKVVQQIQHPPELGGEG